MENNILQEQIQYYRDRASEYDEWFFRQGRYDRGAAHCQQWFAEIAEVEAALFSLVSKSVLFTWLMCFIKLFGC